MKMRLRFLKTIIISVVETKVVNGDIIISEYDITGEQNRLLLIDEIIRTENPSIINARIERDGVIKTYTNIDITKVSILNMPTDPTAISTNSPPKPCGGCPGK